MEERKKKKKMLPALKSLNLEVIRELRPRAAVSVIIATSLEPHLTDTGQFSASDLVSALSSWSSPSERLEAACACYATAYPIPILKRYFPVTRIAHELLVLGFCVAVKNR